jgi:hypothetical protein
LQTNLADNVQVDIEWEPSSRSHSGTSFLDLPLEIRDMIHRNICDDSRREGYVWEHMACGNAAPEMHHARPEVFSDCAIMRTCHQMHSEFAKRLYAIPMHMEFKSVCLYIFPFSPLYQPLVRSVLAIYGGPEKNSYRKFPAAVQIANALNNTFPNLDTQRVGWRVQTHLPEGKWCTPAGGGRGVPLLAVLKYVQVAKRLMHPHSSIPHNMELVELESAAGWETDEDLIEDLVHPIAGGITNRLSSFAIAVKLMRAKEREENRKKQRVIVEFFD